MNNVITDLIVGTHSISEAIKNPRRNGAKLFGTEKSIRDFKNQISISREIWEKIEINKVSVDSFQNRVDKAIISRGFKPIRIPSHLYLEIEGQEIAEASSLFVEIEKTSTLKLFCLDQVTDVHNGAAILRTAAFYGINALVVPQKGSLGLSPSFFRIASGATEYVRIVKTANLAKFLRGLMVRGVECLGFTEHTDENIENELRLSKFEDVRKRCLVLGAEDKGLSHAVHRILEKKVALKSKGALETLNVSVAAAIAMERYF